MRKCIRCDNRLSPGHILAVVKAELADDGTITVFVSTAQPLHESCEKSVKNDSARDLLDIPKVLA